MDKCIKCDKAATKRLTPDLDIRGVPVCEACKDDVKLQLLIAALEEIDFEDLNGKK